MAPSEQSWEWPSLTVPSDSNPVSLTGYIQRVGDQMSGPLSGPDATLDRHYTTYKQLKVVDAKSGQAIALAGQLSTDLSGKISSTLIGQPGGVASLDAFGKVPVGQLPPSNGNNGGGSLILAAVAASDVTAESNKFYPLDTSGGGFNFIVPDFPDGTYITAKDHKNTWDINPVTLKGNVEDSTEDFILDGGGLVELVRTNGTWKIINPIKAVTGSLSDINVTVTQLQTQVATVSGIAATAQVTADNATTPAEVQALIDASPGGSPAWSAITGIPATFPPSAHAGSHASGGADPVALLAAQIAFSNGTTIQAAFDSGQLGGGGGATVTSGLTNDSALPGTTLNDVLVGIDADKFDANGVLPQIQVSGLTTSLLAKQDATPAAPVNFNNQRGINVDAPVNPTDVVNKAYADAIAQGLSAKQSCRFATTVNIALTGVQTVDGGTSATNDRILVKNQSTLAQNGIYVANSAGAWSRAADIDTWAETQGALTLVVSGTTQANTGWVSQTIAGGTIGTTPITFAQFSAAGNYTFNGRAGPNFTPQTGDYTTAQITGISAYGQTLVDDADAATARATLGLGNSATRAVGTVAGTVADGADSRFVTTSSYLNAQAAGGGIAVALAQTEVSVGTVTITPTSATSQIHITASAEFTKDTGTTARTGVIRVRRGTLTSSPQVGQDGQGFSQPIASTKYLPRGIDALDIPGVTTAVTYTLFAAVLTAGASTAARYEITAVEERATGAAGVGGSFDELTAWLGRGTTLMSIKQRFADLGWNIHEYGALGNGSADDTPFIQAAIDNCNSAGGGTVRVPWSASSYRVSGLVMKAGVALIGKDFSGAYQGTDNFRPIFEANNNGPVIDTPCSSGTPRTVDKLGIRINGAYIQGIYIDGRSDLYNSIGVYFRYVWWGGMSNLTVNNCRRPGIWAGANDSGNYCVALTFTNCITFNCVLNRTLTQKTGAFNVEGTDHFFFGGEHSTSINEGSRSSTNAYCVAIAIYAAYCFGTCVDGERSDEGWWFGLSTVFGYIGPDNQFVACRGDRSSGDNWNVSGTPRLIACNSDLGSQEVNGGFSGFKVTAGDGQNYAQLTSCLDTAYGTNKTKYGLECGAAGGAGRAQIIGFQGINNTIQMIFNAVDGAAIWLPPGPANTLAVNSTTPSVNGYSSWQSLNTADTALTNLTNMFEGQEITLYFSDSTAHTSVVHNGAANTFWLSGLATLTAAACAGKTLRFKKVNSVIRQMS